LPAEIGTRRRAHRGAAARGRDHRDRRAAQRGKIDAAHALARRDVAIVSPFAGTTRDIIELHIDLGGYPVTLIDTAGLRESSDAVEQIGVFRAREKAKAADLFCGLRSYRARAARRARQRSLAGLHEMRSLVSRSKVKLDQGVWISAETGKISMCSSSGWKISRARR